MNKTTTSLEEAIDLKLIVPAYQEAFSRPPWNEKSKCPSPEEQLNCPNGLSAVSVDSNCEACLLSPYEIAYPENELIERFTILGGKFMTRWYAEYVQDQISLAAFAIKANAEQIAEEKYSGNVAMKSWLPQALGDAEVMWLDEVFADTSVRKSKNLARFGVFTKLIANELDTQLVAYRTIEPRMIYPAVRDFGEATSVYEGIEVPDNRSFVTIQLDSK